MSTEGAITTVAAGAESQVSLLSAHTRQEIDHWVAKFPPGRQRSA